MTSQKRRLNAEDCSKWRQQYRILGFFGDEYKKNFEKLLNLVRSFISVDKNIYVFFGVTF